MYLSQNIKKSVVIATIMLVFVFTFSLNAKSDKDIKALAWLGVDEIYDTIRYDEAGDVGEESIVTYRNEGLTLVCTLTVPTTEELCPIVILLPGFFGPRDEEPIPGADETVFERQCRVLASYGIASLRVDFRGYGESEGEFHEATISTAVSDVMAAVDFIRKELKHRVDQESIAILGFSHGGLVGSLTAARDKRIDSLVLWSAPAQPPLNYSQVMPIGNMESALSLPEGATFEMPIVIDGVHYFDITLSKDLMKEIFTINPVAEIQNYKNPLMYIAGLKDNIVSPQPAMAESFLKYHKGDEKLVIIDADHEFDYWNGPHPEKLDDAIYWGTAWLIKTLKY